MRLPGICLLLLILPQIVLSQGSSWLTLYERSGGLETPRYNETLDFCRKLDEASPMVSFTTFGKSALGRDLPLLIIDREGLTDPARIHASGRLVVLLQACIHPGEPDGKDAGLMLVRDLVAGVPLNNPVHDIKGLPEPLTSLLEHVSIIFIPIFNVDGHERFGPHNRINQNGPAEMGWRVTANNLNLNRDFLKADTPEMRDWLLMFNRWMPDFFIDTHTTDGADYQYVITYLMEVYGDMDPGLTAWAAGTFIPKMEKHMNEGGYRVFPYVDFRKWHDPRSGLITEVAPPMLSQGYTSLRNRPGLLIETHMLKPYRQRVEGTYECIITSLEILNREHASLKALVNKADNFLASEAFLNEPFPLQFETSETDSIMVDFEGFEYNAVKSDVSGGLWFRYSDRPVTFRLPYFRNTRPSVTTRLPYAYVVPAQWQGVIERLRIHGIRFTILEKDTKMRVGSYRFRNPEWQQQPYEGRHPLTSFDADEIAEERVFPAGSVMVDVMQPAGRIIPHILEPKGTGSYLSWGFFDAVFEQKEYGESYVLEKMAREMMAADPALRQEFEEKKKSDTLFAANFYQVLNWFYSKSVYADPVRLVYPIGRITDREAYEALKKETTGP